MKIAVIGTGYVGLTFGTCLAEVGNNVVCADIDNEKIENLENGTIPFYEPGLSELVKRNLSLGRLKFTIDIGMAMRDSDVVICAVPTPPDENFKVDLSAVKDIAVIFGKNLNTYKVLVIKSTVPVGTSGLCRDLINKEVHGRGCDFDIVSNPEFLKQGAAVKDTMLPDRIVVGVENERSKEVMNKMYQPFVRTGRSIMFTDNKSAELIKYAANSFLATKISFINEIAGYCELCGGDIKEVSKGIGLDDRIGSRFLHAGIGYGGSCLKKDVQAMIQHGNELGYDSKILNAVEDINEKQKTVLLKKLYDRVEDLSGKTIAVFGLSFKPKTDDLKDAPSIKIVKELVNKGVKVQVYDPIAAQYFKEKYFKDEGDVVVKMSCYEALDAADALMILTEWDEFRSIDLQKVKEMMNGDLILDGRNIYNPRDVKECGLMYCGIGVK